MSVLSERSERVEIQVTFFTHLEATNVICLRIGCKIVGVEGHTMAGMLSGSEKWGPPLSDDNHFSSSTLRHTAHLVPKSK